MASFAIILVVCGALCSIGGMHFPPAEALVTHEESSPFPPLPPTGRFGPPEFVNRDSSSKRLPMGPGLQEWEPGTAPQKPTERPLMKPGPATAEEPAAPDSNSIQVPGAGPDSDHGTPLKNPELGTAKEPAVPDSNPIPVPGTTVAEEPAVPNSVWGTPPKKPGLQDWEPGTPPQKPPKRPPVKPGASTAEEPAVPDFNPIPVPGTAEGPAVPDSNPIPVPGTTVAEELPNSVSGPPPKKPGLQDLRLIPVPINGEEPSAYP